MLEQGLSETQRFMRLFYFYTSVAAHGRSAHDLVGDEAVRAVFYSDTLPGNYCTGHVNLFLSAFRTFLPKAREIDFFGFAVKSDETKVAEGHSVFEVFVDGRWILADPMIGFVAFDAEGFATPYRSSSLCEPCPKVSTF